MTFREHLGSAAMHVVVLTQNLAEDSDDWYTATEAMSHIAAMADALDDAAIGHYPFLPLAEGRYREVPDPEEGV